MRKEDTGGKEEEEKMQGEEDGRERAIKRKEKRLPWGWLVLRSRGWNTLCEMDVLRSPLRSQVNEGTERSRSSSNTTASMRWPSNTQITNT